MIHVGVPVPAIMRLHIRGQIALQQATRLAREIKLTIRSRGERALARAAATLPGRKSAHVVNCEVSVNDFVDRYDELIDLLCWAANEGVKDNHRIRFSKLRGWFVANYDAVRPALAAYLPAPSDRAAALCDPFESLFIPISIDSIVHSTAVLSHIQTTRYAVESYRQHMELAAA